MPKLSDHGLGGGGKGLGVPVYPYNNMTLLYENNDDDANMYLYYDEAVATAPVNIQVHASCVLNDDIYFIGTLTNNKYCYKYNVKTKIWTRLSDTSVAGDKEWAEVLDNNIYYGQGTNVYRYNPSSDSHTSTSSETTFIDCATDTDGEYVYRFGGNGTTAARKLAVKLDVKNKTRTTLTTMPVEMYNHCVIYGGDGHMYLFGGQVTKYAACKYNIADNTFSFLRNIPVDFNNGLIAKKGNIILLINGVNPANTTIYAYDISKNVYNCCMYTKINRGYGHSAMIDDVLYLIGGTGGNTSGDSLKNVMGIEKEGVLQRLNKDTKIYTNGFVSGPTRQLGDRIYVEDNIILKQGDAVTIPSDGDYALVDGTYATIGG